MAGKPPEPNHYWKPTPLITVPVLAYLAASDSKTDLVNMHVDCVKDGRDAPLSELKRCTCCNKIICGKGQMITIDDGTRDEKGNVVPLTVTLNSNGDADLVKVYKDSASGTRVSFSQAEIDQCAAEKDKNMETVGFCELADIPQLHFGKPYYLGPVDNNPRGTGPIFQMYHQEMLRLQAAAVVQYKSRGRDHVGIIVPTAETLVLYDSFYLEEIRSFADKNRVPLDSGVPLNPDYVQLVSMNIKQMLAPFTVAMADVKDGYMERIRARVAERLADPNAPLTVSDAPATPGAAFDLMTQLKSSLELRPKRAVVVIDAPAPADVRKPAAKAEEKKKPAQKRKTA